MLNRSLYRYSSSKSTSVARQNVSQYSTGFLQVYHKVHFEIILCVVESNMTCHDVPAEKINYFSLKVTGSKARTVDCCFVVVAGFMHLKMVNSAYGINRTSGWNK